MPAITFSTITFSQKGSTCRIALNRPDRLNAVTGLMYEELQKSFDLAEGDQSIRVVTLTGEGRAFCVGADLKEHNTQRKSEPEKRAYAEAAQKVCARIQESPKPFICTIRGYALGAGAEMALSCDFVIMDEGAEIGFPEIRIGTYVGGGLSYSLPQLVGMAKTKELLFLGERIPGHEASRIGLVYKAVATELIDSEGQQLADRLSRVAPVPLGIAKQQLRAHASIQNSEALSEEVEALLRCMATEDWQEGVRAFNEKRAAKFKGH